MSTSWLIDKFALVRLGPAPTLSSGPSGSSGDW